jgi:hypothetical protein
MVIDNNCYLQDWWVPQDMEPRITKLCRRQHSHSWFWIPWDSWLYFSVSRLQESCKSPSLFWRGPVRIYPTDHLSGDDNIHGNEVPEIRTKFWALRNVHTLECEFRMDVMLQWTRVEGGIDLWNWEVGFLWVVFGALILTHSFWNFYNCAPSANQKSHSALLPLETTVLILIWGSHGDHHSPATSAEVRKTWIYTPLPHTPSLRGSHYEAYGRRNIPCPSAGSKNKVRKKPAKGGGKLQSSGLWHSEVW